MLTFLDSFRSQIVVWFHAFKLPSLALCWHNKGCPTYQTHRMSGHDNQTYFKCHFVKRLLPNNESLYCHLGELLCIIWVHCSVYFGCIVQSTLSALLSLLWVHCSVYFGCIAQSTLGALLSLLWVHCSLYFGCIAHSTLGALLTLLWVRCSLYFGYIAQSTLGALLSLLWVRCSVNFGCIAQSTLSALLSLLWVHCSVVKLCFFTILSMYIFSVYNAIPCQ